MKQFLTAAALGLFPLTAAADDPALSEATAFSGQIFHIDSGVPGLVIAAVRGDEDAVFGFGEIARGSGIEPDGDTRIGVGSISKTFTGLALAALVDAGAADLTGVAAPHVTAIGTLPERDGRQVRLIDLATHAAGLPRETEELDGVARNSDAAFAATLENDPLMFAPGTGIFYSNVGFNLLAMALAEIGGKPYAEVLQETVLDPLGLSETGFYPPEDAAVFDGYDWNGNPMDAGQPVPNDFGASSLYTTANDMVRYLRWNLDRFGEDGSEIRALSHAAHVIRDGLDPVYGVDISGHMDAMGLGWVIMMPDGDRPLIIQKSGGANGVFSYIAFAPARGVGVFVSINQYDFSASAAMAQMANGLITALAPR